MDNSSDKASYSYRPHMTLSIAKTLFQVVEKLEMEVRRLESDIPQMVRTIKNLEECLAAVTAERDKLCESGVVEASTIMYRSMQFGIILLTHFPRVRPRATFLIEGYLGLAILATSNVGKSACHSVRFLRSC
ncbi:hypothetical protein LguiA_011988 [Lonicera macranthoides]